MYLHQNKLTGTIPASLGNLPHLNRLLLHFNSLTGTLAPELASRNNVRDFYLNGNELSGAVPEEWCQLITRADSTHNVLNVGANRGLCGEAVVQKLELGLTHHELERRLAVVKLLINLNDDAMKEPVWVSNRCLSHFTALCATIQCGPVPRCFASLRSSTGAKAGTYLLHGDDITGSLADNGRVSGYCDLTPPTCTPPVGAVVQAELV